MAATGDDGEEFRHHSPLTRKLGCFLRLRETERATLRALEEDRVEFPDNANVINAGDDYGDIYVILEGWAIRHVETENGERQIANFILPGDFACMKACLFNRSEYAVSTITPVTAAVFSPEKLYALTAEHPRLALAVSWCNAREESILVEHLVNVGRRNAYQRVAHLLLELWRRLELVDLTLDGRFPLPVTQAELADSLGLSLSHVNRTMRRLHDDGLIGIAAHMPRTVSILDKRGLIAAADFHEDYLHFTEVPRRIARILDGRENDGQDGNANATRRN